MTPRSLADTTRSIPVKHDGKDKQADGRRKTISLVFTRLIMSLICALSHCQPVAIVQFVSCNAQICKKAQANDIYFSAVYSFLLSTFRQYRLIQRFTESLLESL